MFKIHDATLKSEFDLPWIYIICSELSNTVYLLLNTIEKLLSVF